MQENKAADRRVQIETAAFGLLALKGYKATSMLEVAKRAHASNETLYKWYGNKQGLFLSMITRTAEAAQETLRHGLTGDQSLWDTLDAAAPLILGMMTGQRAIVLARAAVGDVHDTGTLGRALSEMGRGKIVPLLAALIERHAPGDASELAEVYFDTLVGDLQIRRAMGDIPLLDSQVQAERTARAARVLRALLPETTQ